jgi:hypothetical protein
MGFSAPALILEAQMTADPGFLLLLYAEAARLLQQQDRQIRATATGMWW